MPVNGYGSFCRSRFFIIISKWNVITQIFLILFLSFLQIESTFEMSAPIIFLGVGGGIDMNFSLTETRQSVSVSLLISIQTIIEIT